MRRSSAESRGSGAELGPEPSIEESGDGAFVDSTDPVDGAATSSETWERAHRRRRRRDLHAAPTARNRDREHRQLGREECGSQPDKRAGPVIRSHHEQAIALEVEHLGGIAGEFVVVHRARLEAGHDLMSREPDPP
jgi:hypothetical protein